VPLYQAAPCTDCHGSHQENSVEDMVFLDYDAGVLRERAWQNGWYWFMGGVLVFVIMTTTIVWFVYRFVLIPLHHLIGATGGQLTSKVGENEFGILAQKLLEPVNSEKHFLQALFDAIPDGIRVIAPNHAVIMANQAYYHQLGLASHQTINQPCYVTTYARQRPCSAALIACPMQEVLKTGKGVKILTQHQHAEGALLPVEVCAAPLQVEYKGQTETFVVESIRELTLTPHFSHEMKLASVGQLAANVAHDIKSPLSSIRLVLQSSLRDLNSSQANLTNIANSLALVDQQIDKCLAITQRLLTLASPADESSQLLALNEIIGETLALLAVEAKERGIRIRTHFQRNNHYLLANEHDIRMLILNLLQNAFNAMPSGGEIDITIQPHLGQIQLTIQDTGVGIHPTMIEKIFDPFFSHRVDGKKSSGLGLAICKSIVERYQGHIEVNSHIQRGSQFLITLPAAQVST
jgi:signal transduction histidine kinase